MNNVDVFASAVAVALGRELRLSAGPAAKFMMGVPFGEITNFEDFLEWCATNSPAIELTRDQLVAARDDVAKNVDADVHVVPISSASYPMCLRVIEDAPPVIYIKGNVELLSAPPGVSVVGTRKASSAGMTIATRIAHHFAERQWTIVSGLAMGIDAAAHRGALEAMGPTIAVLAHGLQEASPKANALLGDQILASNGAWVSEHSLGTRARPEYFVLRNRIQIGLSAGSIIVEGEERSGTMTQAEFCLRNKRHLFAVLPERAEALRLVSKGPLILINKRGATPLRSRGDYDSAAKAMEEKRAYLSELDFGRVR